jgi:oxygen-independent coproporphyrinogen-3 oxidase
MLGLYVHIPFCSAICNYCNFNRGLFDSALKARYVQALIAEIHQAGSSPAVRGQRVAGRDAVDTIYFGGGTPTLLSSEDVVAIVDACRAAFDVSPDCEVTLEANPETVTVDRLKSYRAAGANRISFGVQSFRDDELKRLSRVHDAHRATQAIGEAREAGFDNLSLDLMMWLPGQDVGQWLESVDSAIGLAPEHLSLYMLEVYPNAPLKDEMARAAWSQAPDDDVAAMYVAGMERLEAAGYVQYEISNVARPGRMSRHNLKYWTDGEWLGLGCGAHSTRDGARWKNVSSTEEYIARLSLGQSPMGEKRCLTFDERLGDALFTGLRLSDGVDVHAVNARYITDIWRRYGAELQSFIELGLLEVTDSRWRLTRQGVLLGHEVMAVFV